MTVVPNEWLVEWLAGSFEYQRRASRFLDKIEAQSDALAIRLFSPFVEKLKSALKEPSSRRLWLMLYNSDRVRLMHDEEISPLPQGFPDVPGDDRYLVELAYAMRPCTLVTTDGGLLALKGADAQITIQTPEEFMAI